MGSYRILQDPEGFYSMLQHYIAFYMVFLYMFLELLNKIKYSDRYKVDSIGFVSKNQYDEPILQDFEDVRGFQRILCDSIGFYRILQEPIGCYRMLQDAIGCYRMLQDPIGSYRILQDPIGSYRDPIGSYRILVNLQ